MLLLQQIPLPATLAGRVDLTDRNGDCTDDNPAAITTPLANVKITLKDDQGNIVGTTFTDADGNYFFDKLLPGNYTVLEETPPGLIDADSHVGTIDGVAVGDEAALDRQVSRGGRRGGCAEKIGGRLTPGNASRDGVSVEAQGEALDSGARQALIRVRNDASGRVLQARVLDAGFVEPAELR